MTLAIDILFFDTIPFILTISRNINFHTMEKLSDREYTTILECLKRMISVYNSRDFYIQYILADGKFRHISGYKISEFKCHFNYTATGEHVPEVERGVRTIKERIRCMVNSWPYTMVPQVFKSLMKFVIFWINAISQENSILPNICSKAIMTGQFPDFNRYCKIDFGTYVHVHNPRGTLQIPWLQGHHQPLNLDQFQTCKEATDFSVSIPRELSTVDNGLSSQYQHR